MTGERDLKRLLAELDPWLDPDIYVFASTTGAAPTQRVSPLMQFHEAEGLTLILTQADAARAGLGGVFPCRRITLRVHSALDAVGLIAAVSAALSEAGISTNPVSGFFHDHVFVAEKDADRAMDVLRALAIQPR